MQQFDRDLMFLLNDVARLLRTRFDQRARACGMTRAQWVILAQSEREPGLSQNELARFSKSNRSPSAACRPAWRRAAWSSAGPIPPTGVCGGCICCPPRAADPRRNFQGARSARRRNHRGVDPEFAAIVDALCASRSIWRQSRRPARGGGVRVWLPRKPKSRVSLCRNRRRLRATGLVARLRADRTPACAAC